jgi:hypothetical protein
MCPSSPTPAPGADRLPVPVEPPRLPSLAGTPAQRLLRAWVADLKPTTIRAYRQDANDFAAFVRGRVVGVEDPVSRLPRLLHGEANGLALAYRADLIERRR